MTEYPTTMNGMIIANRRLSGTERPTAVDEREVGDEEPHDPSSGAAARPATVEEHPGGGCDGCPEGEHPHLEGKHEERVRRRIAPWG